MPCPLLLQMRVGVCKIKACHQAALVDGPATTLPAATVRHVGCGAASACPQPSPGHAVCGAEALLLLLCCIQVRALLEDSSSLLHPRRVCLYTSATAAERAAKGLPAKPAGEGCMQASPCWHLALQSLWCAMQGPLWQA